MKKFGLIGHPIGHSMSPTLFRAGYGLPQHPGEKEGPGEKEHSGNGPQEDGAGKDRPEPSAGANRSDLGAGKDRSELGSGANRSDLGAGKDRPELGAGANQSDLGAGKCRPELGAGANRSDLGAGKYRYDLIEGSDFRTSYETFLREYDGINVTAPFKDEAFRAADVRSPQCEAIGAANLLVKKADGVHAYNSDYYGVILSILAAVSGLPDEDLPARPTPDECRRILGGKIKTALVAGCGGAGKAAAAAASDMGLDVTIVNRSRDKAEALAANLTVRTVTDGQSIKVGKIEDFWRLVAENDLIIYTLPVPCPLPDKTAGMKEAETGTGEGAASPAVEGGRELPLEANCRRNQRSLSQRQGGKKFILEANYRTPFFGEDTLREMRKYFPMAEVIPGERWLLFQAYSGYDLFTGEAPSLEAMSRALEDGGR